MELTLKHKFKPKQIKQLQELIRGVLKTVQISQEGHLKLDEQTSSSIISAANEIWKMAEAAYFDKNDAFVLLFLLLLSQVNSTLKKNSSNKITKEAYFTDLVDDKKLHQHVDEIIEELLSYPKSYQLFVPIPNILLPFDKPVMLSDSISMIKMDEDLLLELPETKLSLEFSRELDMKHKPQKGIVYLCICFNGFVEIVSSKKKVLRTLKQLLAALIIGKIISTQTMLARDTKELELSHNFLLSENKGTTFKTNSFFSEASFLNQIFLDEGFANLLNEQSTAEDKTSIFEKHIGNMNLYRLFSSNINLVEDESKEIERIKTSLEWYFDGLVNQNETFRFILFATSIEALLGDPKKTEGVAVTEQLSDRCAFLTAKNSAERATIKKNFKKAYDVRSKIIHQGKSRLDDTEKESLTFLQDTLGKAIKKEIEHLPRN